MRTLDLPQELKRRIEKERSKREMGRRRELKTTLFIQTYLQKGFHYPEV